MKKPENKIKNKGFLILDIALLLILIFFFLSQKPVLLEEPTQDIETTIHFFQMRGCPECAIKKEFLQDVIMQEYTDIKIIEYDITEPKYQEKFHEMMNERGLIREDYDLVVPTTFIENNVFQGFYEDDKELIRRAINGEYVQDEILLVREDTKIRIPLIDKEIDVSTWALPVVALIIGSIDGLNVCSIGALILVLMIVLTFKSRKKIFVYGGLFILTVAVVYGLLVFVWTFIFDILARYIGSINMFIGLFALVGGRFFLREYIKFLKYGPSCGFSENKFIVNATNKIKHTFENKKTAPIYLTTSIIIFSAIVTLVELPCSIGLPMVYAGILVSEGLSWGIYALYILLYLFFYMLVQLIIFTGAVITKEVWFAESKMITWIYLAGTLVLFFLAYYYLFGF